MSYRYMRVIVFFDLPVITAEQRRVYARFRKFLIKSGFMMMQESVYCKLALNPTVADTIRENIKRNKPEAGIVQMMTITEKQFENIEFITGKYTNSLINDTNRLVVL